MTDSLNHYMQLMLPAVETEMRAILRAQAAPGDLFEGMLHYHMGWVDHTLQPIRAEAGKRIRPVLCLLCCAAAGGDWTQALPAAAALEILHNFSLVHDDIEDGSPTRRGRPTLWQLWGAPQAINAGDALFALAHLALGGLSQRGVAAQTVVHAYQRFDATCLELTRGQHADMQFERRDDVTVEEYIAMIRGKTASLIALAAELGAMVAGAPATLSAHYATFGLELGLAFQVRDDILGIWGDEGQIGKSAASDILTKKKTLPVLYGLRHHPPLRHHYTQDVDGDSFVAQAVTLLDASGAYAYAADQAAHHSALAIASLEHAQPAGAAGVALWDLTAWLLNRQS